MNISTREEILPLTPQAQQILLALALGPANGYEVMRQVKEDTKGFMKVSPGSAYPALERFLAMGLVAEAESRVTLRPGRIGRVYRLAGNGRQVLEWEIARQSRIAELAQERLDVVEREGGAADVAAALG